MYKILLVVFLFESYPGVLGNSICSLKIHKVPNQIIVMRDINKIYNM